VRYRDLPRSRGRREGRPGDARPGRLAGPSS
jgi:hypothetical protein